MSLYVSTVVDEEHFRRRSDGRVHKPSFMGTLRGQREIDAVSDPTRRQ